MSIRCLGTVVEYEAECDTCGSFLTVSGVGINQRAARGMIRAHGWSWSPRRTMCPRCYREFRSARGRGAEAMKEFRQRWLKRRVQIRNGIVDEGGQYATT